MLYKMVKLDTYLFCLKKQGVETLQGSGIAMHQRNFLMEMPQRFYTLSNLSGDAKASKTCLMTICK